MMSLTACLHCGGGGNKTSIKRGLCGFSLWISASLTRGSRRFVFGIRIYGRLLEVDVESSRDIGSEQSTEDIGLEQHQEATGLGQSPLDIESGSNPEILDWSEFQAIWNWSKI